MNDYASSKIENNSNKVDDIEEMCTICKSINTHKSKYITGLWFCVNHGGLFVPEGKIVVDSFDIKKEKIDKYKDQINDRDGGGL
jgi:hypothetical protein